jgi:DEAD/DEAH box helicase domain-containing protein
MRTDSRPITITKELVNNKEGYRLKIRDSIWEIEPQVYLDAAYDVAVPSRPDFIIWPIRGTGDQKPVAVFTDGFQYHKDIVADDTLKREAIRRSGRFRVFSLSWKDVESVFHVQNEYATATLLPQKMPSGAKVYQPTVMNGHAEALKPDAASRWNCLSSIWNLQMQRMYSLFMRVRMQFHFLICQWLEKQQLSLNGIGLWSPS